MKPEKRAFVVKTRSLGRTAETRGVAEGHRWVLLLAIRYCST